MKPIIHDSYSGPYKATRYANGQQSVFPFVFKYTGDPDGDLKCLACVRWQRGNKVALKFIVRPRGAE